MNLVRKAIVLQVQVVQVINIILKNKFNDETISELTKNKHKRSYL